MQCENEETSCILVKFWRAPETNTRYDVVDMITKTKKGSIRNYQASLRLQNYFLCNHLTSIKHESVAQSDPGGNRK